MFRTDGLRIGQVLSTFVLLLVNTSAEVTVECNILPQDLVPESVDVALSHSSLSQRHKRPLRDRFFDRILQGQRRSNHANIFARQQPTGLFLQNSINAFERELMKGVWNEQRASRMDYQTQWMQFTILGHGDRGLDLQQNSEVAIVLCQHLTAMMGGILKWNEHYQYFEMRIPCGISSKSELRPKVAVPGLYQPISHDFGMPLTESALIKSTNPERQLSNIFHHILVVDDNPMNQKILVAILTKICNLNSSCIEIAYDGNEATEKVITNHQTNNSFDLVFMDIQMPVCDGITATKQIKTTLGKYSPMIVAVTANAMEEERIKCYEAGMIDFICKPISPTQLKNFIMNLGGSTGGKSINPYLHC